MEYEIIVVHVRRMAQPGMQLATRDDSVLSAEGLTRREREVAALIARGLSNRELAEQLVITVKTVKNHIQRVLDKLGARSRTEVAARAFEFGLLCADASNGHPSGSVLTIQ